MNKTAAGSIHIDMNKTTAGSTLFQFHQSQWIAFGCHSKKLPQPVQIYGITELE